VKNTGDLKRSERINLWERVVLILEKRGKKSEFLSRIEDIKKDSYVLEMPIRQSGSLLLEKGDNVEVTYNRKDAAYSFKASIMDLFEGESKSVKIVRLSEVERKQRRRYVRLDISGKMKFRIIESSGDSSMGAGLEVDGNLLNISAGGVLFESPMKIQKDSIVILTFSLKGCHMLENILAVIKRCEKTGNNNFLMGAELVTKNNYAEYGLKKLEDFLPQGTGTFGDNLQKLVVQFIYQQQIELRKKGLLQT
jgi:c-di-GMP-binding flagellar brake protein YcgR